MDYRIFNVRTAVNAYDYKWGCTDTVMDSALKVDSGRKIPCRTRESNVRRLCAGPMLYQLSFIPTLMISRKKSTLGVVDTCAGPVRDVEDTDCHTQTITVNTHSRVCPTFRRRF